MAKAVGDQSLDVGLRGGVVGVAAVIATNGGSRSGGASVGEVWHA